MCNPCEIAGFVILVLFFRGFHFVNTTYKRTRYRIVTNVKILCNKEHPFLTVCRPVELRCPGLGWCESIVSFAVNLILANRMDKFNLHFCFVFLWPCLLKMPFLLCYVTSYFHFVSWCRVSPGNIYFLEHAVFFKCLSLLIKSLCFSVFWRWRFTGILFISE
jgi:hypothetical protein